MTNFAAYCGDCGQEWMLVGDDSISVFDSEEELREEHPALDVDNMTAHPCERCQRYYY
jgi:aryl carrier-like protein